MATEPTAISGLTRRQALSLVAGLGVAAAALSLQMDGSTSNTSAPIAATANRVERQAPRAPFTYFVVSRQDQADHVEAILAALRLEEAGATSAGAYAVIVVGEGDGGELTGLVEADALLGAVWGASVLVDLRR